MTLHRIATLCANFASKRFHNEIFMKRRALSWGFVDLPHKYMSLRGAIVMIKFEGSMEEKCNVLWFVY